MNRALLYRKVATIGVVKHEMHIMTHHILGAPAENNGWINEGRFALRIQAVNTSRRRLESAGSAFDSSNTCSTRCQPTPLAVLAAKLALARRCSALMRSITVSNSFEESCVSHRPQHGGLAHAIQQHQIIRPSLAGGQHLIGKADP